MNEEVRCLRGSASPYITDALSSPVKWWGWCSEAFEKARHEGKPILIDVGAGWCHWCHVMDEETYSDPEVAELLNNYFIPIKVDRDEKPDVDRRLQEIAMLISGQGGWPLTVILTPNGDPLYAATYLPPRDKAGLPGMVKVLNATLNALRFKSSEVAEAVRQVREALSQEESATPSEPSWDSLESVINDIVSLHDDEYGGFGTMPKFPQPTFHTLLLHMGYHGDEHLVKLVTYTLRRMYYGGVYDQLGGGFHRYSVDREWLIPHFEKLLIDNAELLANYAEAYAVTGDVDLRNAAMGITSYLTSELWNPEGGFYASQDADVDPSDEGGYYRWSIDELRSLLSNEEFELIYRYLGVYRFKDSGEKAVLHVAMSLTEAARLAGIEPNRAEEVLRSAISKLRQARSKRPKPRIDRTVYTNWSSAAALALMEYHDYVNPGTLSYAVKTVDYIMSKLYINGELRRGFRSGPLYMGSLDDYAYTLIASIQAFSHTGEVKYLSFARELAEGLINNFEAKDGGFYDTKLSNDSPIGMRVKPIFDTPNWSPNALAIMGLQDMARLGLIKGDSLDKAVKSLYPLATRYGRSAASYFITLWRYLAEPPKVIIIGDSRDDEAFLSLWKIALSTFRPGKLVIPLTRDYVNEFTGDQTISYMVREQRRLSRPLAFVCAYTACSMPIEKPESLRQVIETFMVNRYMNR
ncbi:thioredoxin domain-containing protein [Caldivirga maquilingensis]|uniref:Spermatogenesis-associated protein 20-like TRX domain-containing protein n=1 Tax=Caldivirga maquilingensis (strain ATCC 700844 / DSM 13496 / JCM 10307 / IC-167) TaxID=397948 RepID=A8MCC3_CALMQ|nr:thioredoxin domain-containing protein [Caldivirga maquilingensis]ABW01429.1 protein of unknown function DUF255 [Caldivirga maquilingensis IC-167]